MNVILKIALFTLMITIGGNALAETRYVTDQLKITLRSGESSKHKILRMLPSGTPLEVISSNPETGYSRVRTPGGTEGYVLTRQLLRQPVARDQLAKLQQEVNALKKAPGELSKEVADLKAKLSALQAEHKTLQREKQAVEQELVSLQRTSSNAVRIANERNSLRKQVAELTEQNAQLKQENQELSNTSLQSWFMVGAGVLAGGIVLGLILPNLRVRRKRSSWDSL